MHPCPSCGGPVQAGQLKCDRCGQALDAASLQALYAWRAHQQAQTPPPPIVVQQRGGTNGCLIALAIVGTLTLLVCGGLFGLGILSAASFSNYYNSSSYPSSSGAGLSAGQTPQDPVAVSGRDTTKSAPFYLQGGSYTLNWTATVDTGNSANFISDLKRTDGRYVIGSSLSNVIVQGTESGSTHLYNLSAGEYYISTIGGCTWTMRLTQP